MANLLHIRVGKEMKEHMQRLIDSGMFSTEAEIAREGIRSLLFKYSEFNSDSTHPDKREKKEK